MAVVQWQCSPHTQIFVISHKKKDPLTKMKTRKTHFYLVNKFHIKHTLQSMIQFDQKSEMTRSSLVQLS